VGFEHGQTLAYRTSRDHVIFRGNERRGTNDKFYSKGLSFCFLCLRSQDLRCDLRA
jgi:hypothetical protein